MEVTVLGILTVLVGIVGLVDVFRRGVFVGKYKAIMIAWYAFVVVVGIITAFSNQIFS